jgi:hypothetical protein
MDWRRHGRGRRPPADRLELARHAAAHLDRRVDEQRGRERGRDHDQHPAVGPLGVLAAAGGQEVPPQRQHRAEAAPEVDQAGPEGRGAGHGRQPGQGADLADQADVDAVPLGPDGKDDQLDRVAVGVTVGRSGECPGPLLEDLPDLVGGHLATAWSRSRRASWAAIRSRTRPVLRPS